MSDGAYDRDLFGHAQAEEQETYPDSPGHRGIDTSVEAAQTVASVTGRLRTLAYTLIRDASKGLTTDELSERSGIDRGAIQPRTSELKAMGRIRDSGERRRNTNGKRAIVWIAVAELAGSNGS